MRLFPGSRFTKCLACRAHKLRTGIQLHHQPSGSTGNWGNLSQYKDMLNGQTATMVTYFKSQAVLQMLKSNELCSMHHKRYISFQAASSMVKEATHSGQNNIKTMTSVPSCRDMPRFTMQYVPSTPKPKRLRKIKPIISAGACVFWVSDPHVFFSRIVSLENK